MIDEKILTLYAQIGTQFALFIPVMKSSRTANHSPISRGFTLVELLVVITIVAVLAGMAFVAGTKAKNSAMKARELNNIRSISQVVFLYHTDYNKLPGPVNRGIRIPSKVSKSSRPNFLSTMLIDLDFFGKDDEVWQTAVSSDADRSTTTYLLNSTINSVPTYFFGRLQSGGDPPKTLSALQSNLKVSLGGKALQDPSELWMICTADNENYGSSPLITDPTKTKSAWSGRFYSFFDGRVEFFRRQSPSVYPSSFSGGYQ
jgi:prepilin-type N-terminal cleavage/methylation domain-containing protein